jgi:hypothetical protein
MGLFTILETQNDLQSKPAYRTVETLPRFPESREKSFF